jgi:hypothetical protein
MSSQIIPLKGRTDLRESQANSGHRDYSLLSCGVGQMQLECQELSRHSCVELVIELRIAYGGENTEAFYRLGSGLTALAF